MPELNEQQFPVWRGVPASVHEIRTGDWVASDDVYARSHADALQDWTGEPHHVLHAVVPAHHVEWAGERDEWHAEYGEKREYLYRGPTVRGER